MTTHATCMDRYMYNAVESFLKDERNKLRCITVLDGTLWSFDDNYYEQRIPFTNSNIRVQISGQDGTITVKVVGDVLDYPCDIPKISRKQHAKLCEMASKFFEPQKWRLNYSKHNIYKSAPFTFEIYPVSNIH